jgi:TetR/AcrR family transcriptional repressor of uid operon
MRKVDPVKHEEKRREILTAAQRCFARDGFQGASTSQTCKEAKNSPGHLYHYFASKEDIVKAIAEMRLEITGLAAPSTASRSLLRRNRPGRLSYA